MKRVAILTALMAEAVPLVDYYQLKKLNKRPHFHGYRSEDIDLIVTGVGAKAMRRGLQAYFDHTAKPPQKWFDLGIAGGEYPFGCLLWVHQVGDYQIAVPTHCLKGERIKLISLRKPSRKYCQHSLYDMEGEMALHTIANNQMDFSPRDFFCAKVISDNRHVSIPNKDKKAVRDLLANHVLCISEQIKKVIIS